MKFSFATLFHASNVAKPTQQSFPSGASCQLSDRYFTSFPYLYRNINIPVTSLKLLRQHNIARPSGTPKKKVALIGKGLTFDSGGYNIKVR